MEKLFKQINQTIMAELRDGECLGLGFGGEQSAFTRINAAKVRQIGNVDEADLGFNLILNGRRATGSISLSGDLDEDLSRARGELQRLRTEVVQSSYVLSPAILTLRPKYGSSIIPSVAAGIELPLTINGT